MKYSGSKLLYKAKEQLEVGNNAYSFCSVPPNHERILDMKDCFYIQNFSKAVMALENSKDEAIREARHSPGALSVLKTELENINYLVALISGEVARLDAKNPELAGAGF